VASSRGYALSTTHAPSNRKSCAVSESKYQRWEMLSPVVVCHLHAAEQPLGAVRAERAFR
jgi:hypothetical protein